ncbi:hypothetical protein Tco_0771918 [Tanacetum coccineum]|uniref:Uncharacterized protein n=1 Tax=Tanacetum coccineum TaxID=301880 RepID=A0ABQ4ZHJ4_9ASTR
MSNYIKHMGSYTLQQLKRLSFDELKNLFEATMRRVGAFVPMETEIRREVHELATGSSKRDAEEELDQGSSKRKKISENSKPAEESKEKENDELSQEELQQLMIIVPEEGMNVESLQTKYLIIDWEIVGSKALGGTINNEMSEELLRKISLMAKRQKWGWKFGDYFDLCFVDYEACFGYLMSKHNSFFNHEVTFFPVKDKICIFATLKHFIKIVQAVIKRASKDGEIIHEYFNRFFDHVMKYSQHAPLESSRSVT